MYLEKQSYETAFPEPPSALEEELEFGAGIFGFSPGTSTTESFLGGKLILRRIGVGDKRECRPKRDEEAEGHSWKILAQEIRDRCQKVAL